MSNVEHFRFLHPEFLLLLLLVPLVIWAGVRTRRLARPTLIYSDLTPMQGLAPTWRTRVDAMLPWLRGIALALGVLALARPQHGTTERRVRSLGIDIVLCLDVSGSMQAMDMTPNRLEAAKASAIEFVARRPNDRIAVTLFGESAALLCPPTLDHEAVQTYLSAIQNNIIKGGRTAIGTGLALSLQQLEKSTAKSRVVVLLTDGDNNAGTILPMQAAEAARALGVRVYTIGIGSERGGPTRVRDQFGRIVVQNFDPIDEKTLRGIAELTGGRYFNATDNESLQSVYAEIDRLERTEMEIDESADFDERFPFFWFPALGLLALEVFLRALVLRRIP